MVSSGFDSFPYPEPLKALVTSMEPGRTNEQGKIVLQAQHLTDHVCVSGTGRRDAIESCVRFTGQAPSGISQRSSVVVVPPQAALCSSLS